MKEEKEKQKKGTAKIADTQCVHKSRHCALCHLGPKKKWSKAKKNNEETE